MGISGAGMTLESWVVVIAADLEFREAMPRIFCARLQG